MSMVHYITQTFKKSRLELPSFIVPLLKYRLTVFVIYPIQENFGEITFYHFFFLLFIIFYIYLFCKLYNVYIFLRIYQVQSAVIPIFPVFLCQSFLYHFEYHPSKLVWSSYISSFFKLNLRHAYSVT